MLQRDFSFGAAGSQTEGSPGTGPRGATRTRIRHFIALGSTATRAVLYIARRNPEYADAILAADGESIPELKERPACLVSTASYRDLRGIIANAHLYPALEGDSYLRDLAWPPDLGVGAGQSRPAGWVKFMMVSHLFGQQLSARHAHALGDFHGERVHEIVLDFIASSCGGTGSGSLLPATLLGWNRVREQSPGVPITIRYHLLNASCFLGVVTDPEEQRKLKANTAMFIREFAFFQNPDNLRPLCDALDIETPQAPLVSQVFDYHMTDAAGRSYPNLEDQFERVRANCLADANDSVAAISRGADSNLTTRAASLVRPWERVVSSSQSRNAFAPSWLPEAVATVWLRNEGERLLRKPEAKRVDELSGAAMSTLALVGKGPVYGEIHRTLGAILDDKDIRPRDITKAASLQEIVDHLTRVKTRFDGTIQGEISRRVKLLTDNYGDTKVGEAVGRVWETLLNQAGSSKEVLGALEQTRSKVADYASKLGEMIAKATKRQTALLDKYSTLVGRLARNAMFAGRRTGAQAAEVLTSLIEDSVAIATHDTFRQIVVLHQKAIEWLMADVEARVGELRDRVHLLSEREGGLLAALADSSDLNVSVIAPDEVQRTIAELHQAMKASGLALDHLPLAEVLGAKNAMECDYRLDAFWTLQRDRIQSFVRTDLPDLRTFCSRLRLRFDIRRFIEDGIRTIARSSPVDLSAVGHVAERTVIVASGDDYESVAAMLERSSNSRDIQLVRGSDGSSLTISRRMDGLPLCTLPVLRDAERAAKAYPRPQSGVSAWQSLLSCGFFVGALDLELMPSASPPEEHPPLLERGRLHELSRNGH